MLGRLFSRAFLAGFLLCSAPRPAAAERINDNLEVYGYFQAWMTIVEEMEDARGLIQHPSGDEAADYTSGFRLHRLRLGMNVSLLGDKLGAELLLKLEGDPGMLDIAAVWRPVRWLTVKIGQFRIPSTAENLRPDRDLDFVLRTELSDALADYSLSKTNYASSLFHGNRSYRRDFGLGLEVGHRWRRFAGRVLFMMGNGLGANLFISGDSARGFLITNKAQFFYGVRAELEPWPGVIKLGGHFNYNRHDNVVFNSGRVVLDLARMSGSGNLTLSFASIGLELGALGGYGQIDEDANLDGRKDFRYYGGAAYLLWDLQPLLRKATRGALDRRHHIVLGFRYERYSTESDEAGAWTHKANYTVGLSYRYWRNVKLQFNAILHRTDKPFFPDLDDDLFVLSLQFAL